MPATESADHRQQAFDRTAPARGALAPGELVPITVDIPTAVGAVLAALPRIRALAPRFVEVLLNFDLKVLDALEDYALATQHAHLAYVAVDAPVPGLFALHERAVAVRGTLMSDASALARRGLIDGKRLVDFTGPGYRNVATGLGGVAMVLRESWPKIEGKTALDSKELDEASALADQLLTAAFAREKACAATAAAIDTRMRAFTVLARAYDEVRAAVLYLRHREGDADAIAPSLYAGRSRPQKSPEAAKRAPTAAPPPSAVGAPDA